MSLSIEINIEEHFSDNKLANYLKGKGWVCKKNSKLLLDDDSKKSNKAEDKDLKVIKHSEALHRVESLKSHLKKHGLFILTSPKFNEECELMYKTILAEIEQISKRCIALNAINDKYFVFSINSCGFVDFSIMDSDCLTYLESFTMDWNLATKKHKYYNNEGYFDEYSIMLFKNALNEITTINSKIDKWE